MNGYSIRTEAEERVFSALYRFGTMTRREIADQTMEGDSRQETIEVYGAIEIMLIDGSATEAGGNYALTPKGVKEAEA